MKYSWLELNFADKWQWVRKRSKHFWVKDIGNSYRWVKFTNWEIENYFGGRVEQFYKKKEYLVEDWRR